MDDEVLVDWPRYPAVTRSEAMASFHVQPIEGGLGRSKWLCVRPHCVRRCKNKVGLSQHFSTDHPELIEARRIIVEGLAKRDIVDAQLGKAIGMGKRAAERLRRDAGVMRGTDWYAKKTRGKFRRVNHAAPIGGIAPEAQ